MTGWPQTTERESNPDPHKITTENYLFCAHLELFFFFHVSNLTLAIFNENSGA